MDPITHVLGPALWTEPLRPPCPEGAVYARWRERAALVLAALLPDCDGLIGWVSRPFYASHHRVATHSLVGLAVVVLVAAALARQWPERWLLPFLRTESRGRPIVRPRFRRLAGFALVAAAWHWVGDWITAWGGMCPLWPFSDADVSLSRVDSLESAILVVTAVCWAVQHHLLGRGKRKSAWVVPGFWLVLCALYVWLRPHFGEPAVA
ncbi:MAG TPA: metal-dependent hydrolase [Sumerlaeia bacterium]|nr:metal-dependent hydrolase [Sumerlaeia bacterium]